MSSGVDFGSKKVRHRRMIEDGLRCHQLPRTAAIIGFGCFEIVFLRNNKCADIGVVGRADFGFVEGLHPAHRQFHVRLAGTQPHIAEQNIFYFQMVIADQGHCITATGFVG